jgi:tetratricopeptide (TPR) repeat protein
MTGEAVYRKYGVPGTPFLLFLDGDGKEIDWIRGYSAPPEKFHEKVLRVLRGEDTFKALTASYAANPKDVQVLTKLAAKYYDRVEYEKAVDLYKEIIAADPDGKMGTTEYGKGRISCTELAEFLMARATCYGLGIAKRESGPLERFLEKYPTSKLKKEAYSSLSAFYTSGRVKKEDAEKFFDRAFAQYPDDPWLRYVYASEAIYSKENLDRAIEVAEGMNPFSSATAANIRAQLYAHKGDLAQAEAVYGKEFGESLVTGLAGNLQAYSSFWIGQKTNLDSAEKMLLTAIQLDPLNTYCRQTLADFYLNAGQTEKALKIYGPEFIKAPGLGGSGLVGYTQFWTRKKQNTESALEALEMAVKSATGPGSLMDRYAMESAAQMFYQLGKPDRALAIFGPSYIQERMYDPLLLSGYTRFWAQRKTNLESALAASETAIKFKESNPLNRGFIWISLSSVYFALDRLEDARKAAEKAIEVGGGFNTDYYKSQLKKIQEEIDKKKK